jgi:glycosyltransferase involved in cell wall biosynthesis
LFVIACIPAFNEEKVIADLISDVSKYVDSVVVCDDGSADDTANVSKKSDAFVIKHDKNMGKGAALSSLFDFARHSNADIIITIDGDGQFLPKEIPSPSIVIIISALECLAKSKRDDSAAPFPIFLSCFITNASDFLDTLAVSSAEPSSQTTTLSTYFETSLIKSAITFSSLNAGIHAITNNNNDFLLAVKNLLSNIIFDFDF